MQSTDGRIGYGGLVVGHAAPARTPAPPRSAPTTCPGPSACTRRDASWELRYRKVRPGDFWVQDNGSRYYNRYRNQSQGGFRWWLPVERRQRLRAAHATTARSTSGRSSSASTTARCATAAPGSSCTSTAPAPRPAASARRAGSSSALMGRLDPRPAPADRDRPLMRRSRRQGGGARRRRRPHPDDQQPPQGALPAHRLHQGRGAQLLRPGLAGAAAAAQGPVRDPDPLAARRPGGELLREEHPARHAVLGAHREGPHHRLARPVHRATRSSSRSSTTWPR